MVQRVAAAWTGQPANAARGSRGRPKSISGPCRARVPRAAAALRSTRGRTASRCTCRGTPARSCSTRRPARGSAPTSARFRTGSTSRRCASTGPSGAASSSGRRASARSRRCSASSIGIWMYSPSKRYRNAGVPTSIPYRGQKRWHTIFGLIFGLGAVDLGVQRHAVDGSVSVRTSRRPAARDADLQRATASRARCAARADIGAFAREAPARGADAARGAPGQGLEFTSFAGEPVYLATLAGGDTRIVPVGGSPDRRSSRQRIIDVVTNAVGGGAAWPRSACSSSTTRTISIAGASGRCRSSSRG